MTKMTRNEVKNAVIDVLQRYPSARSDDKLCYILTAGRVVGQPIGDMTFAQWLVNKDVPNFETVRRTRQRAQREHPELRDPVAVVRRDELEHEWREWARGNIDG